MANDVYTANEDGSCFAGLLSKPSWVLNQPLNTWGVIPFTNKLEDLNPRFNPALNPNFPNKAAWEGSGSFNKIIEAWCGAAFSQLRNELIIAGVAGHDDYAGGESYGAFINSETPAYRMIRPPSGAISAAFPNGFDTDDGQEASGVYADGRPRAMHTYNKTQYIEGMGFIFAPQGNVSHSAGNGTLKMLIADPDTGEIIRSGSAIGVGSPGDYSGGGACHETSTNKVWVRASGTGRFHKYDVDTDTWQINVTVSKAVSNASALTYIPEHNCIFWLNQTLHGQNTVGVVDCATGIVTYPSFTGSLVGMAGNGFCQPRYIGNGEFLVWNNTSATTTLNKFSFAGDPRTATWQISQMALAESNSVVPTVSTQWGTYGRFWCSDALGICGMVNAVNQEHYFYRYK